jgi:alkyl sulfatase BDS1-like metallo-beta-lactamase superfamily hydrolase
MAGMDPLELADRLWRGEVGTDEHHPLAGSGQLVEVTPRTAFLHSFANVSAFSTEEGLVLVDTGSQMTAEAVHRAIRGWTEAPLRVAVYTHGHIDHVFGVGPFDEEASASGASRPRVIAHEGVPDRFERYRLTAGWNAAINRRQFRLPALEWPTEFRLPDETYRDDLTVMIGGEKFELHHARGETDDHTWVWIPARRVLCTGDLFIWALPNAGNPQKVQRYPREWAAALRTMAALDAEILLPGHGLPVIGAERVRTALGDTAEVLESLHDQTVHLMNGGVRLDEILHSVRVPAHLADRPFLQPVYDDPEFVVRNVWRFYGGWWDGNPSTLKPAPEAAVAREAADLAGGAARLAERAREVASDGDLRLAGHLIEWARLADPADEAIAATYRDILARRSEEEPSTMAKNIFGDAADRPPD